MTEHSKSAAVNIIEKIWQRHIVESESGYPSIFAIDAMLLHEVTSAQAFDILRDRKIPVYKPERLFATLDHSIPTAKDRHHIADGNRRIQVDTLRSNARQNGIRLFDIDSGNQGVVHVIGPEQGITQPGLTIVCGDSHTSTHGAFGALAFGVGTTEVAYVLATGCLLRHKPKTMKVAFKGSPPKGTEAKDVIMKLIATIGIDGANGHVIEYCGPWIESLTMEERMTVCNMSIECGARAGLIAPDETTFAYLKGRPHSPKGEDFANAIEDWRGLESDPGCQYDQTIELDIHDLRPMVSWGTNPEQAVEIGETIPTLDSYGDNDAKEKAAASALRYTQLEPGSAIAETEIQWAFLGSCTNGRIEDLRSAAKMLKGRKVDSRVTFYVTPGSENVQKQAEDEGLAEIFRQAGADFRNPGCSMCLAMNEDKVPAGLRCISSSNRNFVGRQGKGSITHLASPSVVAASAVAGRIVDPSTLN